MTGAAVRPRSSTARDTAIVLVTTALGLALSLGTQSLLAWFLEPVGRGQFAVCVTFASVAAVVLGLATDRAVQYHLIARTFSVGRATVIAYVSVLGSAALSATIGWLLIDSGHPFFAKAELSSFRLSLALIPLTGLCGALDLLLIGMRRFEAMGFRNVVGSVANVSLTALLVGALGLGVDGALWALILGKVLLVFLQSRAIARGSAGLEWPRLADFRLLLSYALRYYLARTGNVVNVQVGMIVMAWLGEPAEIGLFAAASVLMTRVMVIPNSVATALQPRVGPEAQGRSELVARASRLSFVTVGAALAVLLASSSIVVPILLSEAFASAVPLLWLMAPGVWIKAAAKPTTSYFIGVNRPGIVSISTGVELAVNLALMPLLFRRAGLAGAAAAASVAYALSSLVLLSAFRTVSGLRFGETWLPRRTDYARVAEWGRRLRPYGSRGRT